MARPAKEKNEKRSIRLTFRMNKQEQQHLQKLSDYTNLPASEVIRETVFKKRLLQPRVSVIDQQTYVELKRIGNNVNQIAKHLNSGVTKVHTSIALAELSAKLDQLIRLLINAG
jgi:hypothetical protein